MLKQFRASNEGGSCSAFSKAEEGHNNEWWLAGAGYAAKSLGKQPRSHSSPHSPRWITVQCPSANLLNLVWPQETQDTSRPHAPAALSAKAAGDLPVSSTGQALHSSSPLPTTLHVSQDTRLNREEIDFTQRAIFIPPGCLFFTSGAEAWRYYGCWLQVRASTKTHAANSALPACSGVYNTLSSKEKKKVPRQLLKRNWPQIQTILNRCLLSWITARGVLENTWFPQHHSRSLAPSSVEQLLLWLDHCFSRSPFKGPSVCSDPVTGKEVQSSAVLWKDTCWDEHQENWGLGRTGHSWLRLLLMGDASGLPQAIWDAAQPRFLQKAVSLNEIEV